MVFARDLFVGGQQQHLMAGERQIPLDQIYAVNGIESPQRGIDGGW